MKSRYQPMFAKPGAGPFDFDDDLFEIKWDGVRAIAYVDPHRFSMRSRNDREISGQFPELAGLTHLAPGTVLDGEIVAMVHGEPDMQALLPRLQVKPGIPPQTPDFLITYIIFDILEKDGKPLIDLPLEARRKILEETVTEGPHIAISVPVENRGTDYYCAVIAQGLDGVMAKKKDSRYDPGERRGNWLKIKELKTCDCVIAGYTPGRGGRGPAFGALVLGLYEERQGRPPKNLVYIGKVGTGFSDLLLEELMKTLGPEIIEVPQLELPEEVEREKMIWLNPVFVCEVAYMEVTRDCHLRIPRFIRLRNDKRSEECTIEQLAPVPVISDPSKRKIAKPDNGGDSESVKLISTKAGQALARYQQKRHFSVTKEPEGEMEMTGNSFVIQEHHSRRLHYDFRLERNGVLKSWAVPKGVPEFPGAKHLAVAVEDHPLEYGGFEGTIPKGEYGVGTVSIWDSGTYETKFWDKDKIEVNLHGRRLNGHYVLVTFKRAGKDEWLIFKAS